MVNLAPRFPLLFELGKRVGLKWGLDLDLGLGEGLRLVCTGTGAHYLDPRENTINKLQKRKDKTKDLREKELIQVYFPFFVYRKWKERGGGRCGAIGIPYIADKKAKYCRYFGK